MSGAVPFFARIDNLERRLCQPLNGLAGREAVRRFFSVVSWLGDGKLWYTLMALLPAYYGTAGLYVSLQMAITGGIGVLVYKLLKENLVRERPYITWDGIIAGTPPLDEYSFPSGHTLHAVAFSLIALSGFPELWLLLVPFTVLVMVSRVLLGLHYPSDVLIGAGLGLGLAQGSFLVATWAGLTPPL